MVSSSMGSQRSANDAWSPYSTGSTVDTIQESCNCSTGAEGILDPEECDPKSGQCSCDVGYVGLQCEDCEESFFTNGTSGCLPCACDSYGAVNHLCDSSGTCVCKTGVYGPKCDDCHPGFFHFSSTGCRPCQCNNHTSNCHPQSGVCLNCEGNTQGSNCEECRAGFYRSPSSALGDPCVPCPCSNTSSNGTCHTDGRGSAVCDRCLPAYTGPQCAQCSAGFFRRDALCVPCDCSGNSDPRGPPQICHPQTGQCLSCINNTTGPQCQLCTPGYVGDAKAHNCTRPNPLLPPTPVQTTTTTTTTTEAPTSPATRSTSASTSGPKALPPSTSNTSSLSPTTTQALLTSLGSPTDNTTAALTEVSWTQFNIIILAVIILVVLLLLGFVGGVYTYREYQNRKLNAPFWTIELKEDNISFSSYHDSIPNADVSGLLEDEANEVAPNGQLALTTQGNCYKA
uniref:Laminin EGF-like domain-containing protein n=1 Tax=Knipowitschia caucasica TaxID=637954 RepID=A0AAV2MTG6_KNICA